MSKIHGRPLLPWWVYALYFAFAITVAAWHSIAHGDEMKPATGKTAEKAKHGRNGDRFLAHINPMEAAILKAMGGAGTINPKTGYKEYYDEGGSGFDPGYGEGGYADPGASTSDATANGGGLVGDPYNPTDPGTEGGVTGSGGIRGPGGGGATFDGGVGRRSMGERISAYLADQFDPRTQSGMFNAVTGLAPGFGMVTRGLNAFTEGLGRFVGQPLNEMFGGNAVARASPAYDQDAGSGGTSDYFNQSIGTQPVAAPTPAFMRPAEEPAPPAFGMAGGMTDLQRRAQIATGGTQGNAGQFRTPEAMRYYGNLIARALIGDNNAVSQQSPNLLPIEDTYLKQVFGVTPQNNSATLLDALKPYWSR